MVGQGHLRRGEALHPLQGLIAEQGREVLLPGLDLQLDVGDRRGGGHGVAPEGAKPLHVLLHAGIAGEEAQGVEDVVAAHLLEAPEQVSGVIEHDPRVTALGDQLGKNVSQPPVAVSERLGIVVVAHTGMVEHPLKMGDQLAIRPGGNRGLVHVQRTGKGRMDRGEARTGLARSPGLGPPLQKRLNLGLAAGNRWQGEVVQRIPSSWSSRFTRSALEPLISTTRQHWGLRIGRSWR